MIRHKAVVAAQKALERAPIIHLRGVSWDRVSGYARPGRKYAIVPASVAAALTTKLDRTDGRVRKDPSKRIRSAKRGARR